MPVQNFIPSSQTTSAGEESAATFRAFARKSLLAMGFVPVVLALTGCPPECTSTLECNVGEVCSEGACVAEGTDPEPEAPDTPTPDEEPPETEILGDPAALTNANSVEFTFACADDVECGFECALDDGQFGFCTSPAVFNGLAEGEHRFRVRGIRADVFIDETPAEHVFVVDQTPPETILEETPAAITASARVEFALGCTGAVECTYACTLNGNADGCGPFPSLADGVYAFTAAAIDEAGNVDPTPAEFTFEVDTAAPETVLVTGPPATTGEDDATFTFECDEEEPGGNGCTFECALDAGAFAACATPFEVTDVEAGAHTVQVRAIDAAGNVDDTAAEQTWTVDGSIPVTQIDSQPPAATPLTTANITFSCNRPEGCTYECSVDTGPVAACGSPLTLEGLADGEHTVVVTAMNAAGTPDPNPPTVTFFVDTVVPETVRLTQPPAVSDSTIATFEFTCTDPDPSGGGCVFECGLDDAPYESCESPKLYNGLADGEHRFEVRARDSAGNLDVSPELFQWRVDTTAPNTVLDVVPDDPTSTVAATFEFSCTDESQPCTFECAVDAAPLAPCTSPLTTETLAEGEHAFSVVASDALDHVDLTAATHTWTIDLTAPETNLSGPVTPTNVVDAEFVFSCNDEPCTFTCAFDGAAPAACTSPVTLSAVDEGQHTFEVTATDSGNTVDPSPALWAWEVDVTAPVVVFTLEPTNPSNDPTPTFEFECEGGETCTFECAPMNAPLEPCNNGTFTAIAIEGIQNRFDVFATDLAGNRQNTDAARWNTDFDAPNAPADVLVTTSMPTNEPEIQVHVFCEIESAEDTARVAIVNSNVSVVLNSNDARNGVTLDISSLEDGKWSVSAFCMDALGNESGGTNADFDIDRTAPSIDALEISNGPNDCAPVLTWSSDDEDVESACSVDGVVVALGCTSPEEFPEMPPNSTSLLGILLVDTAGNETSRTIPFQAPMFCF